MHRLHIVFAKSPKGRLPSAWGALNHRVVYLSVSFDYNEANGSVYTNKSCQLVSPYVPEWSNLTNLRGVGLNNLGLQGPVPLNVFADLPHLQNLDFRHNQFTTLPAPKAGQFNTLRYLGVSHNTLQGQLPELQGGAFAHLLGLDLTHNLLTSSVPASYGVTLRNLWSLSLQFNMLDTIVIRPGSFPRLRVLDMAHNQMAGKMPNVLPLKRLNQVDLSHNSLTALPDVWWHNMPTDKPSSTSSTTWRFPHTTTRYRARCHPWCQRLGPTGPSSLALISPSMKSVAASALA